MTAGAGRRAQDGARQAAVIKGRDPLEGMDTLPLHEVSPKLFTLLLDFFEQKWAEGKLSELFTDDDIHALLALLSPYLGE